MKNRSMLQNLITQNQMLSNYRKTQSAQSGRVTMDSLYIQVSREEHEAVIGLAIEALQSRVLAENHHQEG